MGMADCEKRNTSERPRFASGRRLDVTISVLEHGIPADMPSGRLDVGMALICLGGRAKLEHNHVTYEISRRDSVQIFPGDLFKMLECSPDFSMSRLTYSSHLFDEVMRNFPPSFISYIESNPVHNLSTSDRYLLHTGYFRVISEKVSDIDNMCRYEIVVNLLRNFFMEIYDKVVRICRIDTLQGKHKSRLVEGFISLLMEHPEHRDVGYYAHELCITPKYLSVIVSEAMGLSAKDFIDRNVTLEIQYMLRTTDMSVKEIAERLEFPSSSSLCRYFRMHAGMTVTEYRRSAMG